MAQIRTQTRASTPDNCRYRIAVIELTDVGPRVDPSHPHLFIGLTLRAPDQLAKGLAHGRYRPKWAHGNVVGPRKDLTPKGDFLRPEAMRRCDRLIQKLRSEGYTVNRNTAAYRTYVINLVDPDRPELTGRFVYVGQTSKDVETRLVEHLTDVRRASGQRLASSVVTRYGVDLNKRLMNLRIYTTQKAAVAAEKRLAERLIKKGYTVKGGH